MIQYIIHNRCYDNRVIDAYPHLRTHPHSTQLQKPISLGPAPQKSQNQPSADGGRAGRGEAHASHLAADRGLRRVHVGQDHSLGAGFSVELAAVLVRGELTLGASRAACFRGRAGRGGESPVRSMTSGEETGRFLASGVDVPE